MYDFLSIGDVSQDTFLDLNEADIHCTLHKEACELCLRYADKIPVANLTFTIGGNAGNNAVGLSRLGFKTAWLGMLGHDDIAQHIFKTLRTEGVSHRYAKKDKLHNSNYSTILNYQAERTILVYHQKFHYSLPTFFPKTFWVYLTSLGPNFEPLYPKLLKKLSKKKFSLAFNPGTYQLKMDKKLMSTFLALTDILFVNVEEAELLFGSPEQNYTLDEVKTLIDRATEAGVKVAVITDGQKGAYAGSEGRYWFMPLVPGERVEATGAGDSFASGFLGAYTAGHKISECLRWGATNAASVVAQIGPLAGLLTEEQMKHHLEKFSHFIAQEI